MLQVVRHLFLVAYWPGVFDLQISGSLSFPDTFGALWVWDPFLPGLHWLWRASFRWPWRRMPACRPPGDGWGRQVGSRRSVQFERRADGVCLRIEDAMSQRGRHPQLPTQGERVGHPQLFQFTELDPLVLRSLGLVKRSLSTLRNFQNSL